MKKIIVVCSVVVLTLLLVALPFMAACAKPAPPPPPPTPAPTPAPPPPPPTPAEFKLTSLAISPDEVVAGSTVTARVGVANIGEVEGTYVVTLKLNGKEADSEVVTLAGEETKTVSFTIVTGDGGMYTVKVNGLTKTLRVSPMPPAGYEGYTDWENGFFIAYPEGWRQEVGGRGSIVVSFGGPVEDGFRPNYSVAIGAPGLWRNAEGFDEVSEKLKSLIPDYKAISTEDVIINDIPAVKHVYTAGGIKCMTVYLRGDKAIAIVVCGTLVTNYNKHEDTFDTIVDSFRWLL